MKVARLYTLHWEFGVGQTNPPSNHHTFPLCLKLQLTHQPFCDGSTESSGNQIIMYPWEIIKSSMIITHLCWSSIPHTITANIKSMRTHYACSCHTISMTCGCSHWAERIIRSLCDVTKAQSLWIPLSLVERSMGHSRNPIIITQTYTVSAHRIKLFNT